MAPGVSRELVAALSTPALTLEQASNAIEEYILYRRSKGDSLFDVSAGLLELERRNPRIGPAVRHAQYVTNIPPPSDLTPPSAISAKYATSTAAILAHLVSDQPTTIQQSREIILEFVLAREQRLRDKKPGRGGKGTLGREGFEELATHLREIEDGLRGMGPLAHAKGVTPPPGPVDSDEDLDERRQMGLALVLSLRMLLSYFTLPELARQLLQQTPTEAERTLVQHVRRRAAGEGRYGVGRELEFVESLTLTRRPALRPAFRSARARTLLPARAAYPITLPAASKSGCIKLLQAFIKDIEIGGPSAAQAYVKVGTAGAEFGTSPAESKSSYLRRRSNSGSPKQPTSPVFSTGSAGSPPSRVLSHPMDPTPVASYALELISEYVTREKREHMLKYRWAKYGREQLSRDLGDIEAATCLVGRNNPAMHAQELIPTFLLIRRTFVLGPSPLPDDVLGSYRDMLPTPPDPDSVPLREPTISSTTATLYVNPRLDDGAAVEVLEELIENEREKGLDANVSEEKTVSWLTGLIDQIERRFPDGSYETAFAQARFLAERTRVFADVGASSRFHANRRNSYTQTPSPTVTSKPRPDVSHGHRRTQSNALPATPVDDTTYDFPLPPGPRHGRSSSEPPTNGEKDGGAENPRVSFAKQDNALRIGSPLSPQRPASQQYTTSDSSYYEDNSEHLVSDDDSVDSEFERRVAPLPPQLPPVTGLSSSLSSNRDLPPPPLQINSQDATSDLDCGTTKVTTPPSGGTSGGGWWEVLSPSGQSPSTLAPWVSHKRDDSGASGSSSTEKPLPPGAEPARVMRFSSGSPTTATQDASIPGVQVPGASPSSPELSHRTVAIVSSEPTDGPAPPRPAPRVGSAAATSVKQGNESTASSSGSLPSIIPGPAEIQLPPSREASHSPAPVVDSTVMLDSPPLSVNRPVIYPESQPKSPELPNKRHSPDHGPRPPPVPVHITRPNFPSPIDIPTGSLPSGSREASPEDTMFSRDREEARSTALAALTGSAKASGPRPKSRAHTMWEKTATSPTTSQSTSNVKSKFGALGRSMTNAIRNGRDKENNHSGSKGWGRGQNTAHAAMGAPAYSRIGGQALKDGEVKEAEHSVTAAVVRLSPPAPMRPADKPLSATDEKLDDDLAHDLMGPPPTQGRPMPQTQHSRRVANSPAQWNRNMVMGIMGPTAHARRAASGNSAH